MNIFLKTILALVLFNTIPIEHFHAQDENFVIRTFNKVFNDTSTSGEAKLLLYPVLAFSPETRWQFGLNSLYIYHAKQNTKNRLSEINTFAFYTQEKQYGLWIDHAVYTDNNDYFLFGRMRIQQFPLLLSLIHI